MKTASRLLLLSSLQACVTEYPFLSDKPDVSEAPVDTDEGLPLTPDEAEDTAAPLDSAPPVDDPIQEPEVETDPPTLDDPPPADDCVGTSDLIYLVSRSDDGLYLFDPTTMQQQHLGRLNCAAFGDPQSMAVARDGVGYVRWSDDRIYQVDLQTLACTPTSYQPGAFGAFGMGFATDSAGTWRDQLYVANFERLSQLSTQTWTRSPLGAMPSQSELTGTASGQLWAFLPLERPALLAEVDKQTGRPVRTMSLPSFPNPIDIDAFAFAHWGGDFYLFVRVYGVGSSTDVYRVRPNGTMTLERSRIGIDVVGAGSSTCAPTTAP